MKSNIFSYFTAALLAAAVFGRASVSFAETPRVEATTTTVNSAGTITEFGSQSITVKTGKGDTPIRYLSNETTNYVDENGNPVSLSAVKSGQPVTVFYTKVGDTLVASKVMVRTDKPATGRNTDVEKPSDIVPDKVVIEHVPANENVRPVSASTSGSAGGRMIDGFVMSNGRVFQVSRGQALPLTQDLTFRVTPTGFVGFNGQFEGLPEGLMLSSAGAIIRAPVGLRDVNGNVFAMRTFIGSSNTTSTTGASNLGTDRRNGTTSTTGPSGTVSSDAFPAFEFIPLTQNGTQTTAGSQTATGNAGRVNSTGTPTTTNPTLNGTTSQTNQPQSTTPTSQGRTTQPQSTQPQTSQPQTTQPQSTQPQSTTAQPQTGTQPQSTTGTGSPTGTGTTNGGAAPAPAGSGDIGAKQR